MNMTSFIYLMSILYLDLKDARFNEYLSQKKKEEVIFMVQLVFTGRFCLVSKTLGGLMCRILFYIT